MGTVGKPVGEGTREEELHAYGKFRKVALQGRLHSLAPEDNKRGRAHVYKGLVLLTVSGVRTMGRFPWWHQGTKVCLELGSCREREG